MYQMMTIALETVHRREPFRATALVPEALRNQIHQSQMANSNHSSQEWEHLRFMAEHSQNQLETVMMMVVGRGGVKGVAVGDIRIEGGERDAAGEQPCRDHTRRQRCFMHQ
eukprot:TRINITY_DN3366_c0_g1_i3.p2 TRINITY_DN3366_c0_g1~~TRINITY_DN3366_c0_g1_i3.p2  ORF type:complete len:111 (-),score=0.22 TRINITY_DN3366_c0_g1_i3:122-454(-)